MFLSDLHMHTWLSIDGSESVGALCEAALRQGLGAIALTDHWDGFPPGVPFPRFLDLGQELLAVQRPEIP